MATLTIGRIGLEDVSLDTAQVYRQMNQAKKKSLSIEGYLRAASKTETDYLRHSFESIEANSLVPVTWTVDTALNGYYWFLGASIEVRADYAGEIGAGYYKFKVDLEKAGTGSEVWFQNRLTGTVRVNDMGVTSTETTPYLGFPEPQVVWWGQSTDVATQVARVTADGIVRVFYDESIYSSTSREDPKWYVPSSQYYNSAVEIKAGGYIRTGLDVPSGNTTNWELSNGLVRVSPNGSNAGRIDFEVYSGSWGTAKALTVNNTSAAAVSGAWDEVTILRNEPHIGVIRLSKSLSTATKQPIFLDLTMRRGSRFVEMRFNQPSNNLMRVGFTTAENITTGFSITGATTRVGTETAAATAGHKYVMGSARKLTLSTAGGYIQNTTAAKTWDAWVGVELNTTALLTGDASTELAKQYLGALSEETRVVFR